VTIAIEILCKRSLQYGLSRTQNTKLVLGVDIGGAKIVRRPCHQNAAAEGFDAAIARSTLPSTVNSGASVDLIT